MHASQVSSAGASAYPPVYSHRKTRGTDEAAPAHAVERRSESHRHHRSERAERSEDNRPARNSSNPLVNAMMEALKGLTQGAGKATDSAGAATPAKEVSPAASTRGDAPKSVKEAALEFANELYGALRAAGESSGATPKKMGYGDAGRGYGDLAQGLKRLAQSVAAPAKGAAAAVAAAPAVAVPTISSAPVSAAAPKPVSAPVSAPAVAPAPAPTPVPAAPAPKPVAANPETPKPSAPAPAAAASASRSPITINVTFNFVNSTAIGAPKAAPAPAAEADPGSEATADSPLLKAFKELMAALNGESAEGGAAIDSDKAVQMLQSFLQKIAESLGGDASAQVPGAALPAKGSLISVTA